METNTNKKRVDQEVAIVNLLCDIRDSIAEHFGLSEESAWLKVEMLYSLIERFDFIDEVLCDPFDTARGGSPKVEFIPRVLLCQQEAMLDEVVERQHDCKDSVQNQKHFLRTLCGVAEQLFQQSKDTGASAFDIYSAICLLRKMTVIHDPEHQPIHPDWG